MYRQRDSSVFVQRHAISLLAGVLIGALGSLAYAEQASPDSGDCTEIDLRFEALDGPLTDAEIAQRREQAQLDSLNQFDRCQREYRNQGQAGGAGGGQGSGEGGGQGGGVAGSGIAGTQPKPEQPQPTPSAQQADGDESVEQAQTNEPTRSTLNNGRTPLDIPPADSDGALAAQIRQAAESESDPERRARLWNEYRKIRGLPTTP